LNQLKNEIKTQMGGESGTPARTRCRSSRLKFPPAPWRLGALAVMAFTGLGVPITEAGSTVKLAWDPSPSPGIAGYTLYAHTNSLATGTNLATAPVRVQTTNLTVTVQFTNAAPRWYFVATATSTNGLESVPSNELIVQSPMPPANMRTLALEYIPQITGTNWSDVGFFRIRLN